MTTLIKSTGLWRNRYLLLLALLMNSSLVYCQRFESPFVIRYGITDIGGCKIISIRQSEPPSRRLKEWCLSKPTPRGPAGQSWYDYHSPLEFTLNDSLLLAEKWIGGHRDSILDRNTQIVVFSEPYANAYISSDNQEIVISLNDGLLQMIESTVSGFKMEEVPSLNNVLEITSGVTYSDWLEKMRNPTHGLERSEIQVGPDVDQPDGFVGTWFWNTRVEAMTLYHFIFAHELAHIKANDRGPYSNLQLESRRDIAAFLSTANINSSPNYIDNSAILISSFMLAMWYYERYWHEEIIESGRPAYEGSYTLFHTRNWKQRGLNILDSWLKSNSGLPRKTKEFVYNHMKRIYSLRAPITGGKSSKELLNALEIIHKKVNFNRDPSIATVNYTYELKNNNECSVDIIFEVQSRMFPRSEDIIFSKNAPYDHRRKKPYRVFDDSTHEFSLSAGATKVISGELDWFASEEVYPGVNPNFVSVTDSENYCKD